MKNSFLGLFASLTFALAVPAHADAPEVVASIKPVHALAAGVMKGVGEPYLIIKGAASPHTYALKPADAKALQEAKVVLWVGHNLEVFLDDTIGNLAANASVVELSEAEGVKTLPTREGGAFEAHDHGEHEHAEGEHDHEDHEEESNTQEDGHHHGEEDAHIWLDPQNALAMVDAISAALIAADAENAATYEENAAALKAEIEALQEEIAAKLAPVKDKPFVVFHDAYQYFENRFGLSAVGAITLNPEVAPGAQRVRELQEKIGKLDAVCVFAEPQFNADIVSVVTEGTRAHTGILDPLGTSIDAGPGAYAAILQSIADEAVRCLSGK